jgi:hypothetical protein
VLSALDSTVRMAAARQWWERAARRARAWPGVKHWRGGADRWAPAIARGDASRGYLVADGFTPAVVSGFKSPTWVKRVKPI